VFAGTIRRIPPERNVPGAKGVYIPPRTCPPRPRPAISEHQIWLIAIGLIALDLTLVMVPIVPFLAAYVLTVRPGWFKDFIDDVYDRS
jgi:hypothetical protein